MSKKFEFENKLKRTFFIMMGLGAIGAIWAFLWNDGFNSHARFWANILLNTYYFAGIAVTGVFFITAHHLGYSGWQTVFKKIPMAMSKFLYVAFGIMIVITIGVFMGEHDGLHNLYTHWASSHGKADLIVQDKASFLNPTMYALLVVGFFGLWALFAKLMHTKFMSIKNIKEYTYTKALSATFLLIFGVSSSVLSWIVIMSIDPHWYSTLFGWYNLMSYFVAGMSMMVLIIIFLKSKGLLPNLFEDHVHDIVKYIFGFSVFWTYLWFSQYMLIWYANIPEATIWYTKRMDIPLFKFIFFFGIIINFVFPILAILKRKSKRNFKTVAFVAVMLIIGHYLDFYQMIMLEPMNVVSHHDSPVEGHSSVTTTSVLLADNHEANATEHTKADAHATEVYEEHHTADHTEEANNNSHAATASTDHHGDAHSAKNLATIGLPEVFIFIGFLGLFLFITFTALSKEDNLEITEDPYLKESVHHHFDW
tara:strand:- start:51 stop:1487 length:1437 start_codon:yes stop_codon:yes gene_type:complete